MTLEQTFQQIQKKKFWRDKEMLILLLEGAFMNLMIWAYILMNFLGTKGEVVLHSNILIGDITGSWPRLLVYPLLSTGILLVNFVLIFHFYLLRQKRIINLLSFGLLLVQIICLFSVLLIIHF